MVKLVEIEIQYRLSNFATRTCRVIQKDIFARAPLHKDILNIPENHATTHQGQHAGQRQHHSRLDSLDPRLLPIFQQGKYTFQATGPTLVSRSQTLTPHAGEGLVNCYTRSCTSTSYRAPPIRLQLSHITSFIVGVFGQ